MFLLRANQKNGLRCFSLYGILHRSARIENNGSNYKVRQQQIDLLSETKTVMSALPVIQNEILDEQLVHHQKYPGVRERFAKLIDYHINLEPRFLSKAIFFVHAYKVLERDSLTDQKLQLACILAWCHKLIDASLILNDDIADASDFRYNKSTWHKLKEVGINKAILDAAFLEIGASFLMLNHLSSHPQYRNIYRTILSTYSYTNVAQLIEVQTRKIGELEECQDFVKFYAFILPVVKSALYLANIDDKIAHLVVEELSIDIAQFLKVEDDVMCIFSPFSGIQKPCTDISEGRASWLAIEAYKRANRSQKKILEDNYGINNQASVEKVYNIFRELRLKEVYDDFKEEFYEKTYFKIHQKLPKIVPAKLFVDLLDYAIAGQYRV